MLPPQQHDLSRFSFYLAARFCEYKIFGAFGTPHHFDSTGLYSSLVSILIWFSLVDNLKSFGGAPVQHTGACPRPSRFEAGVSFLYRPWHKIPKLCYRSCQAELNQVSASSQEQYLFRTWQIAYMRESLKGGNSPRHPPLATTSVLHTTTNIRRHYSERQPIAIWQFTRLLYPEPRPCFARKFFNNIKGGFCLGGHEVLKEIAK